MKLFERKPKTVPDVTAIGDTQAQAEKKRKPISAKDATHDFINSCKEFEENRVVQAEKSERKAWWVAGGFGGLAALLTVGLITMLPLKQTEPYLVRVDNNTGATDIVRVLSGTQGITDTEATSRYFAAMYVRMMESYDWFTVQDQVNTLMLFSDANMQNQINNKYSAPNAPHKVHADKERVEIKINNLSLLNDQGLIQIRFTKKVVPANGGIYDRNTDQFSPAQVEEKYIATMGYEYVNVPKLDEILLKNPLGFTVKSYRIDKDGI